MTGYKLVNLKTLVEEIGEEQTKKLLSDFVCPANEDVESFLRYKAIEFSKQGFAQTRLVYASYKKVPTLAGYYTLTLKHITVKTNVLTSNMRRRLKRFAPNNAELGEITFAAPLIAQLGKNYVPGADKLITGDELLSLACKEIATMQENFGGRFTYVECEDIPKLIDFYKSNGFCEFDKRPLDRDETGLKGQYLVQMIKYIKG